METIKKYLPACAGVLLSVAAAGDGQQVTSTTLEGQTITIHDSGSPAKNRVTGSLHTEADLAFKGFNVPKGDYSVHFLVDSAPWQPAIHKTTGPKAAIYDPKPDLGRVPRLMIRPPAAAAACKLTLSKIAPLAANLQVGCNDKAGSTSFRLDRGPNDSQW